MEKTSLQMGCLMLEERKSFENDRPWNFCNLFFTATLPLTEASLVLAQNDLIRYCIIYYRKDGIL